jgi:hypothetical protein
MSRLSRGKIWRCLGCGNRMYRELAKPANEACDALIPGRKGKILHICGACKHLHFESEDGMLRDLTIAERFQVEKQIGNQLDRVRAADFAPLLAELPNPLAPRKSP